MVNFLPMLVDFPVGYSGGIQWCWRAAPKGCAIKFLPNPDSPSLHLDSADDYYWKEQNPCCTEGSDEPDHYCWFDDCEASNFAFVVGDDSLKDVPGRAKKCPERNLTVDPNAKGCWIP